MITLTIEPREHTAAKEMRHQICAMLLATNAAGNCQMHEHCDALLRLSILICTTVNTVYKGCILLSLYCTTSFAVDPREKWSRASSAGQPHCTVCPTVHLHDCTYQVRTCTGCISEQFQSLRPVFDHFDFGRIPISPAFFARDHDPHFRLGTAEGAEHCIFRECVVANPCR
jgi:hypothetical protein